jgi:ribosomal protein S18 acetylase RimI-like enzyme
METVKIRNYKNIDYPSVNKILREGDLFDENWDNEEKLNNRINEKHDSILVAVIKEQVVGCVYLVDDILPLIFRLAVKKEFRRQGIGKLLVEEAAKHLRKHGHKEIGLFVDEEKEELKNWYRKQGFKESKSTWRGFWKQI